MVLGVRSCFWWICRTMGHTYRITGGQTCSIISGEDQLVCYLLNLSTWKIQRCIHMFCIVLWCCVFLQCWRLTLTSEELFLQVFRWCDRCASSHAPSQTQEMSTRRDLIWQTSKNLTFFRKTPWRVFLFLSRGTGLAEFGPNHTQYERESNPSCWVLLSTWGGGFKDFCLPLILEMIQFHHIYACCNCIQIGFCEKPPTSWSKYYTLGCCRMTLITAYV